MDCQWIVYYEDGSSFTSEDGKPEDAPRLGVMLVSNKDPECGKILSYNEDGRTIYGTLRYNDGDFYVWRKGQWLPTDQFGMMDYLMEPGAYKVVLWGRMTTWERMHEIYVQALKDPRMVEKTATIEGKHGELY